jgi:hypothetical protein
MALQAQYGVPYGVEINASLSPLDPPRKKNLLGAGDEVLPSVGAPGTT